MFILDIIFWAFAAFVVAFILYNFLSLLFSRDHALRRRKPHSGGTGAGGMSVDASYGDTSVSIGGSDSSGSDSSGGGDFSAGGGDFGGGGASGGW